MALRRVVLGLTGILLAGTAAIAQQIIVAPDPRTVPAQSVAIPDPRAAAQQVVVPQAPKVVVMPPQGVVPYVPADGRIAGQPQAFYPQDFRARRGEAPTVAGAANTGWAEHRTQVDPRLQPQESRPVAQDTRPVIQTPGGPVDYRAHAAQRISTQPPPAYLPPEQPAVPVAPTAQSLPVQPHGAMIERAAVQPPVRTLPAQPEARPLPTRLPPGVMGQPVAAPEPRLPPGVLAQPVAATEQRLPVYEARPGVIDPRVVVPREERYIDYKPIEGRAYDFRPLDYKPVDTRTMEYRSLTNKIPDEKVLDPRLKEKGPEIQARLECKAIMYRAVECNFLDYKEVDPRLQELFAKYPEVTVGVVPKEYSKETPDRWAPLLAHLSREIGLKVSLKIANDYQALIESQRAGLIHIAVYSPTAYARARNTGSKIEAFGVETNSDGTRGSYSVIYALNRGAAPKVEDFRSKSIGLVDPNSISGYSVPRFALASQKIDPDSVLSRQIFTGSHENALVALSQGLVDYAVGQWTSDEDSTLARLLARGALRNVDGTPMRRDDFRVVMKSEMIINSPIAYLSELPEDLKATVRKAFLEASMRDRAAFDKIYDGKGRTWETIDPAAFDNTLDLVRFIDDARRLQTAAGKQAAR